jgi:hypothetical protein
LDKLVKQSGTDGADHLLRIFSGLRVRMAIDYSYCDHSVHEVTGRYSYSGEAMIGCKAIIDAVQSGGQIVASGRAMASLMGFESNVTKAVVVDLGTHVLPEVPDAMQLVQLLPDPLKDRELLPIKSIRKQTHAYADAPGAVRVRGVM